MSTVDLVEDALYSLSYKYFLELNPEDEVINASTLSNFRKLRLKDSELKNVPDYNVSMGNCLYATKIQGVCIIFMANIKRIITILEEKRKNKKK